MGGSHFHRLESFLDPPKRYGGVLLIVLEHILLHGIDGYDCRRRAASCPYLMLSVASIDGRNFTHGFRVFRRPFYMALIFSVV